VLLKKKPMNDAVINIEAAVSENDSIGMIQFRGSGSGIRCFFTPGSGIRTGAMVGSGSGIRDKKTKFVKYLYTKRDPRSGAFLHPGSGIRIRDGAMVGSGSGIKHPGSATLAMNQL
jgi:hypothetical protein